MTTTPTIKLAMAFVAGVCVCLLMGQYMPAEFDAERFPVGRYQLQPRGSTMGVWVLDTTRGTFHYFEPSTTNVSGMEIKRQGLYATKFNSHGQ